MVKFDDPYYIWYRETNDKGEVIREEKYPKAYRTYGWAFKRAVKLYGTPKLTFTVSYVDGIVQRKPITDSNSVFIISHRNPWKTYIHKSICQCCGKEFDAPENSNGFYKGAKIRLLESDQWLQNDDKHVIGEICPQCFDAIWKLMQSRRKVTYSIAMKGRKDVQQKV